MPSRPRRSCVEPRCPNTAADGRTRCAAHLKLATLRYRTARPEDAFYRLAPWRKLRAEWLAYQPDCVSCGAHATTVDHRAPWRIAGLDPLDLTNLQSLCTPCHSRKSMGETRLMGAVHG